MDLINKNTAFLFFGILFFLVFRGFVNIIDSCAQLISFYLFNNIKLSLYVFFFLGCCLILIEVMAIRRIMNTNFKIIAGYKILIFLFMITWCATNQGFSRISIPKIGNWLMGA